MKITMRAARVMAGYGVAEAAARVGYKRASLWRWETGISPIPPDIKTTLCRLYGVREADICEDGLPRSCGPRNDGRVSA